MTVHQPSMTRRSSTQDFTALGVLSVVCCRSVSIFLSTACCLFCSVLQRSLPHNYSYDSIYSLFPLVVPEKSKAYVDGLDKPNRKKYSTNRPMQAEIKIVRTLKAIREVLDDPVTFSSPYMENLIELTGGYG